MRAKKFLFYLLASLLASCVPVVSLHPLADEKNVVFDEKLLGTWVEDANTTWEFSRAEEPTNAYKLIYTLQTKEDGKEKTIKGFFIVGLVKIKDNLFLDVCPAPWEQQDPSKIEWGCNTLLLIPAHTFVKMDSSGPQLKMLRTDDEKMREFIQANPDAVKHTVLEDKPVLTASTNELQEFVLKYAGDKRVFAVESVLTRKANK